MPALDATPILYLKGNFDRRFFRGARGIYVWADGIQLQVRLEDEKQCIPVLIARRIVEPQP